LVGAVKYEARLEDRSTVLKSGGSGWLFYYTSVFLFQGISAYNISFAAKTTKNEIDLGLVPWRTSRRYAMI
jgi:hypothetical protein